MEETLHNGRLVRFGVFEVDLRSGELRKAGVKLKISGQPFQVLAILLENRGEIVTREDLLKRLWPDTFVDGDHNLNTAINKIREVLGDSAESPRFVETLPRRGYRFIAPVEGTRLAMPLDALEDLSESGSGPVVTATPRSRSRWLWVATAGVVVALTALLIAWWRIPATVPVVESVTQLTDDGEPKGNIVSDGSRIYFSEGPPGSVRIAQVSVTGGAAATVQTQFPNSYPAGVKPDGSALLVLVPSTYFNRAPLWLIPLPAGQPRRIGSFQAAYADIFPDGRILFAQTNQGTTPKDADMLPSAVKTDWFVADKNGANPRKLVSLPGFVGEGWVEPDGHTILLSQEAVGNRRLLEIMADGTGLRELRKLGPDECCFTWTLDKKYLVYPSGIAQQSDIWLLPMKTGLFRRPEKPIRLTNGPLPYSNPYPSRDGKQIFALGTKQRGELVRYDMKSHQFEPFLSGISATDPTFSWDGKWVAYVSYPDLNLWRSRSDGSERMQLTYPPVEVHFPSISPDGTKVAFHTDKGEIYVISMEGGQPQRIVGEGTFATWSPDGNYLSCRDWSENGNGNMQVADVRTGKKFALPDSQGMGGFWITEDTLVGGNETRTKFLTFNLKTQQWTDLGLKDLEPFVNYMISPDGKYLYFTTAGADPKVERIRFSDRRRETITSLKDFHRVLNYGDTEVNVAPDGSPIFTRDTGYQEIYALSIRWP